MTDLDRRTKTAINQAIHYRNYRRIRDRSLRRLAQENPDRYKELLEEERARDEAEGKTWVDLSGRTKRAVGSTGSSDRSSKVPVRKASRNRFKTRKLGRKA